VKIICTMNMSDRTVNELDNAITRRFAMIELDEYEEDARMQLYNSWLDTFVSDIPDVDIGMLRKLFEADYQGINHGHEGSSQGSIMRFGPMHYRDVAAFIGAACDEDGEFEGELEAAVGQAYKTFIVPRLLNAAAYTQLERIVEHYSALDDQFDEFDLEPARSLADRQLSAERRQLGT